MGVFTVTMKTHSRENITDQCGDLNRCIVHNIKPHILKVVSGRRKETFYVAHCKDDECSKISYSQEETVIAWNKFNPTIQ